jgi:diguanylate cyclase (GGDEF)-like protein
MEMTTELTEYKDSISAGTEAMFNYMRDVVYYPRRANLDFDELPEQLKDLGEGLKSLGDMITEARMFAVSLSKGQLDVEQPALDNEFAAPLKALLSSLKHLTWQATQVAQGDYKQKVNFMGEFSDAFNDMTSQLAQRRDALEQAAYRDLMTGAYNRHYGMKILYKWIAKKSKFALIFVDMDMLKYVNDVFGHNEGDVYIKSVMDLLANVSSEAIVARLGGDEFMVLIKEEDLPSAELFDVFEKVRKDLAESTPKDDDGLDVYPRSISFGIVMVDENNKILPEDLLSMADERMYEYKKAHKKERRS